MSALAAYYCETALRLYSLVLLSGTALCQFFLLSCTTLFSVKYHAKRHHHMKSSQASHRQRHRHVKASAPKSTRHQHRRAGGISTEHSCLTHKCEGLNKSMHGQSLLGGPGESDHFIVPLRRHRFPMAIEEALEAFASLHSTTHVS